MTININLFIDTSFYINGDKISDTHQNILDNIDMAILKTLY